MLGIPSKLDSRPSHVFTGLLVFCLAAMVTIENFDFIGAPAQERRERRQAEILARQAYEPYQEDGYLIAEVCHELNHLTGLPLNAVFPVVFFVGYLFLFSAMWFWLAQLFANPAATILGLVVVAVYAGFTLDASWDHPSDVFGAGFMAMSLAFMKKRNSTAILVTSLAASFFWAKQMFVVPVLLLYLHFSAPKRWFGPLALAAVVLLTGEAGQILYRLSFGPRPAAPAGLVTPAQLISQLPLAASRHFYFVAPALLTLRLMYRRVDKAVLSAFIIYPCVVLAYVVKGFFVYEMRSFWVCVPALCPLIAVWADAAGMLDGTVRSSDGSADSRYPQSERTATDDDAKAAGAAGDNGVRAVDE